MLSYNKLCRLFYAYIVKKYIVGEKNEKSYLDRSFPNSSSVAFDRLRSGQCKHCCRHALSNSDINASANAKTSCSTKR